MNLNDIISVLFSIWIIRNILYWVALWQTKEYRFDRMLVHLKETKEGGSLLFSPFSLLKWAALVLYIPVALDDNLIPYFSIFVLSVYSFTALSVFNELREKRFKRPKLTIKALIISFLSLIFALGLFFIPLFTLRVWVVIVDKVTTLFIAFLIFVFSYPTELFYDFQVEKARGKIKNLRKLLVIGVTGSYGKSSTKEYIASILSKKFKTAKTYGTNNTKIGVAKNILKQVSKDTQIFVAELGAYKKGEIEEICNMVNPKIGILTAVSPQHASLFGGIANTIEAKYELIKSLPKNGIALFNGNNSIASDLYKKTEIKKIIYKVFRKSLGEQRVDIKATHVTVSKYGISFTVSRGKRSIRLKAPLIGVHNIENILPGVFLAMYLGMSDEEIEDAVSSLTPLTKTMNLKKLSNGMVIIDSTFNVNPQSFMTIFDYITQYRGRRIIVMQPMIELGSHGGLEHYKVGYHASTLCDYLFLTNRNFYKDIQKGITDGQGKCELISTNDREIAKFIRAKTLRGDSDDVIIFLGRETAKVLRQIV